MREPSGHGIRGAWRRGCLFALLALAGFTGARDAAAQTVTRSSRETGRINFVTTGGSLRNSATNTCTLNTTSTTALSGIPAGTTIRAAYLYWGGSGGTVDTSVTLNGTTVTAARTFSATYTGVTPSLPYFGAVANVKNIVQAVGTVGNGNYTFGGLTVVTGSPHCDVSAVSAGWALFVIYESATERVRAINIFDGLQTFRGSSITQTPDGFRVPNSNIDGRIGVFTLEGDPANSEQMNGIDEALRYNGTLLDDGINPPGSDPLIQQFDGTINTQGISTSYGIDVDQYDISSLLTPGQTSGTMVYSSGADLVLLMAQIVSATSDPGVDLAAAISTTGTFISGGTGKYNVTVSNVNGTLVDEEDNTVTVTDTLPTGLTFASGTGTGWTCGAVGQVVTCTHPGPLVVGASFPTLTLTVNVLEAAAASVTNTVTVSTPSFELNTANNSASVTHATIDPSLANSTKTVSDLNGGEAVPGDTLRYTVTLTESAGGQAISASVADDIPANTTFGSFVSIPSGSTSAFTPAPGGANGRGRINVTGITVPANGSVTVVFDVIVSNVSPGSVIDNIATVDNPFGPDATPAAPQVQVSPSQVPQSGTKQLYLWSSGGLALSRTRPTGTHAVQTINGDNQSITFQMTPVLQTALTLNAGNFTTNLLLARTGSNSSRVITATLTNSVLGTIATAQQTFSSTTVTMYPFTMSIPSGITAPAGSFFSLVVNNNSASTAARTVTLTPYSGTNYSRVDLNSATIINVNSVQTWTQAFSGGAQQATWNPGNTLYVRATVSDPFGSFDISGATVSILDAGGNTLVNGAAMTAQGAAGGCGSTTSATCVLQYQYQVPAVPVMGGWTIRVTANEGVEGVSDLGVGGFVVAPAQPAITVLKSSTVLSDPTPTGASSPKRIPGAIVRYDILVTNSGPGSTDSNTLVITDPIPTGSTMYVATTSGNPVVFVNGATASGLTFNYAANVSYSSVGSSGPFTYTPAPDANGFDAAVRAIRVQPAGVMIGTGSPSPSFTIQFRIRIN